MSLNTRSIALLAGVHKDLVAVVNLASELTTVPFIVTEGRRTIERQKALVAKGASQTLNSRHLTGHAVDLAAWLDIDNDGTADGGEVRWDWPLYAKIADAMKKAAAQLDVKIVWGGDWRSFRDGPHFELDRKVYP